MREGFDEIEEKFGRGKQPFRSQLSELTETRQLDFSNELTAKTPECSRSPFRPEYGYVSLGYKQWKQASQA